ncbi:uncharacterized protein isoform X3 [Castor canadensis]|uniref:Uncharacterized protein isoform X3 n=2 Tax=Castor canadensis TaxID=51338 RepID=A0AC58K854_CASCN|nr:probable low-specificity L-threonine aldolase 2 isoform X2 [Castor canadensis]
MWPPRPKIVQLADRLQPHLLDHSPQPRARGCYLNKCTLCLTRHSGLALSAAVDPAFPAPPTPPPQSCRRRLHCCSGWSRLSLCPPTPWPTSSLIAGVHSQPLPDLPHGTLDLDELERVITRSLGSPYYPVCELVCLENTHSSSGGRVLPVDYLQQVHFLAQAHGVRVHLDGARLMNAAVTLRVSPARIVEHCDSVSFCFSKGLGAPVGALIGGTKDFIEEAWRLRKVLGGGMRQAGVLAAAALVGLADAEEVLLRDHSNAQRFAQGLQELSSPICSVDPAAVETNMVLVRVDGLPPAELCRRLQAVSTEEVAQTGQAVSVLLFPWTEQSVRAVWHRDISSWDTELALRKWEFVLKQLGS